MPKDDVEAWPLQDHAGFLPWVQGTFEYSENSNEDDAVEEGRQLFAQQRFVRDYLQHASPYRGLLLLHSLGVGKTCAALATAEALRPSARGGIYVMVTKMLKNNFIDEVPACTRPDLLRRQRWALMPKGDPRARAYASKLPVKMVKANGGVYVSESADSTSTSTSSTSTSNVTNKDYKDYKDYREYGDLDASEQARVDAQVEAYVHASFKFVHYNGLNAERVAALVNRGGPNPFDGAVVIIDEVHNFIQRVMNQRLVTPLYERLLDAADCKVILLSGTPIVNRIAELAYVVNLVQGRQRMHKLRLRAVDDRRVVTQGDVDAALEDGGVRSRVRRAVYDVASKSLGIVLAPPGFELVDGGFKVRRVDVVDDKKVKDEKDDLEDVVRALKRAGIRVASRGVRPVLPLPDDVEVFNSMFVDEEQGVLLNPGLLQRRIVGAVSAYARQDPELFATVSPMSIVLAPMSDRQFIQYAVMRHEERQGEERARRLQGRARIDVDAAARSGQVYRTFSLALCTFVFPDDIERPIRSRIRARSQDLERDPKDIDHEYEAAMRSAVERLRVERSDCLRLDGLLQEHSPKFAQLLQRLARSPGPALVYSQFRRGEGLGLLGECLVVNGWGELRLRRAGDAWVCAEVAGDKRFVVLRSDEDPTYNRVLLQIFNDELDQLPTATRESLPASTNLRGEIAGALMITAAGAEGISLKNVRQVHMLEGYWNHHRLDQVVGRAVRARSHMALPPDERHVDVFMYLATLTDLQREDRAIMHDDKGLSSDEHVYSVAMRKKHLTDQAMALVRSAAVDCRVHARTPAEHRRCFSLPANMSPGDEFRTPAFDDDSTDAQVNRRVNKLHVVEVDGKRYYVDKGSRVLYDYEQLRRGEGLVEVGKLP
jgi:hypothetical protein